MKQGMKTVGLLAALACASGVAVQAQVDEKLKADIISTGYVHSPLPLDESKSFDKTFAIKKVLKSEMTGKSRCPTSTGVRVTTKST